MSGWAIWRGRRARHTWQTQGTWCPFIGQAELVSRLAADLAALRSDPLGALRKPVERAALAALDAWIGAVIEQLRDRAAGTSELDVIVAEWRRRRTRVGLKPERADVIAVAD